MTSKRTPIPLKDLKARDCRWPLGTPGDKDFGFCGAPAAPSSPYCGEHGRRAHNTSRKPAAHTPIAGSLLTAGFDGWRIS